MGTTPEYQWQSTLTLPSPGTYCYRVYLGSVDLLGGDASPKFTTQVPAGAPDAYSFAVFGDWGQTDSAGDNPDTTRLMGQLANSGARFAVTVGDNGYPAGSQTNYGDLKQHAADTSAIFGRVLDAGGQVPPAVRHARQPRVQLGHGDAQHGA